MNDRQLPDDQREQFREFIDRARAHYDIHRPSGRDMAVTIRGWLEQVSEPWAEQLLDDAQVDGLWAVLKDRLKAESVVLVNHNGRVIGKSTRVGSRSRKPDGTEVWAQPLIHEMTWAQVEQWLARTLVAVSSLLVNKKMADRLLSLRDQFPESVGPADACAQLGTSVDDYLAAA